jgi:hypothetical protein
MWQVISVLTSPHGYNTNTYNIFKLDKDVTLIEGWVDGVSSILLEPN